MRRKRSRAPSLPEREETIRTLAYQKWEEAGRPEGDGIDYWLAAEREYAAQHRQVQMLRDALEEEEVLVAASA